MPRAKQGKTTSPPKTSKIEVPMVQPASRMARNRPHPPTTLRVCGNTIGVKDGKAGEADPKVLRQRKKAALRRRGEKDGLKYSVDETRIG